MPNVLFKIVFPCVDVYLVSNYYLFKELVLISMNVNHRPRPVDLELSVKTLLDHSDVNAQQA